MIRSVIIDDEQNNIDNLRILLQEYCQGIIICATALNATEGEKIIALHQPEIIFLDIQMPGQNGFDLLKSLPTHNFEVIFVTAYDQYGIQAVKFSAVDYLLKPVVIDELKLAVKKATDRILNKKQNLKLENLISVLQKEHHKEDHRIAISTQKETRFVNTQSIIRCESSNNYTTFYLENGEKLLVSKPIYEYEEILSDYGFIRCHQSHLINKKFIRSLVKQDGGYLLLSDQTQLPISKNQRELIRKVLEHIRED
ncbi:MAG: LytTR family DNA-binding domain-containing protein [Ginsengibacter sp.]